MKQKFKKVVEWKGEENIFLPILIFVVALYGHYINLGFIFLWFVFALMFITFSNRKKIKRKVYWVKIK